MPSRFFPHPPYAEDQPSSQLILTTHVLHRGFTMGSILGTTFGTLAHTYRSLRSRPQPRPFASTLLWSSGRGALVGTVLISAALMARMHGKTEIEWQDRSWRLLENEGQVLVDDFSVGGAVAGLLAGVVRPSGGIVGLVGRAGLGTMAGTVVYLGWRYGLGGGVRVAEGELKREETVVKEVVEEKRI